MIGAGITTRGLRPCDLCGKPLCHTQIPLFWRVNIERVAVDLKTAAQIEGLAMVLAGNVRLAEAFAPSNVIAKPIVGTEVELLVCESCALRVEHPHPIAALAEIGSERQAKEATPA